MKILIVGAGLSGCSMARLLKDSGHDITIIEQKAHIGGLCVTRVNGDGILYEPFGARTFHATNQKVIRFVTRFDSFNGFVHKKGIFIDGKIYPYPISMRTVQQLEQKEMILQELRERPKRINKINFEKASVSVYGNTLYNLFIKPYSLKMWGRDPKDLEAALAIKRMELRYDDRQSLFGDEWQGLPVHGYSFLLKSMIRQIPLRLNTAQFNPADYDVVVFSGPIDQFFKYRYGKLEYRSLRFYYRRNERWENNNYGTINLPQHSLYIRKCNFKVMHKQITKQSLIQYQKPVEEDDNHMPMYPVRSRKNSQAFDKYLHLICKTHICPIGRLGLFSYLNMDQVVELSFSILSIINKYPVLTPQQRYDKIKNAIKKYNNLENKK